MSGCLVVWSRNKISINKNKQIYFSLFFYIDILFLNKTTKHPQPNEKEYQIRRSRC